MLLINKILNCIVFRNEKVISQCMLYTHAHKVKKEGGSEPLLNGRGTVTHSSETIAFV